ncbi:signal peptidase II [Sphingomonas ginkgonis]|uniref:Lipoprotein signal peptidase n=1 Tax=Sphingomonas ginkgonis TaxID=2315330 RepID=A0A3R9YLM4_9SPHN|nr:signal peptidase II [Sphingomonas ginkgonis]RST30307.1 signal peptidase II [Sphingomonas ginkgonis]
MADRRVALLTAGLVFALDQLVKWLMWGPLRLNEVGQIVLTGFFNLSWVENRGISLGLFNADSPAGRWALVLVTAAIAVAVLVWIFKEPKHGDRLALGLVLGGALGNILDRVRIGYVVDFADLHFGTWRPFLVFNVADAAISIGAATLFIRAFLFNKEERKETETHA